MAEGTSAVVVGESDFYRPRKSSQPATRTRWHLSRRPKVYQRSQRANIWLKAADNGPNSVALDNCEAWELSETDTTRAPEAVDYERLASKRRVETS